MSTLVSNSAFKIRIACTLLAMGAPFFIVIMSRACHPLSAFRCFYFEHHARKGFI